MFVLISCAIAGKILGSVLRTEAYSPVEQMVAYTQQAGPNSSQTIKNLGFDLKSIDLNALQHTAPEPC